MTYPFAIVIPDHLTRKMTKAEYRAATSYCRLIRRRLLESGEWQKVLAEAADMAADCLMYGTGYTKKELDMLAEEKRMLLGEDKPCIH